MKTKSPLFKTSLLALLGCSLIGLAGCSSEAAKSSPADTAAFNGNPNSPEAKAAAQKAAAQGAQDAAAAQAAAQSQKAPVGAK